MAQGESTIGAVTGSREPWRVSEDRYCRSVSITVDVSALRRNLATARALGGGARQFATIKADAYGHGAVAVAQALSPRASGRPVRQPEKVIDEPVAGLADGFAVVTLEEALELRQFGIRQPILVLQGPQTADAPQTMQHHDLWPVIHDHQQYELFRRHPDRRRLRAWLKVDTGMGRLGFQPAEASAILASADGINWTGLMSHFACADEPDNPFTEQQLSAFSSVRYSQPLERSLANSAAILAWPQTRADWARPGIMLYGCNPLDRPLPAELALEPVMSVQAPLISVKSLPQGSGVGYAQSWRCPQDMPVGYAAVGYRDGLPRVLDSSACVTVRGQRCPIIGKVSMDSIAIDLRQVPDARLGEAAELWGKDTPIDSLAAAAGTISYELLTSIRGRRTYLTHVTE